MACKIKKGQSGVDLKNKKLKNKPTTFEGDKFGGKGASGSFKCGGKTKKHATGGIVTGDAFDKHVNWG